MPELVNTVFILNFLPKKWQTFCHKKRPKKNAGNMTKKHTRIKENGNKNEEKRKEKK